MGPIGFPEVSANNYQFTPRNILEERRYKFLASHEGLCTLQLDNYPIFGNNLVKKFNYTTSLQIHLSRWLKSTANRKAQSVHLQEV
jgi:hypothetical protein